MKKFKVLLVLVLVLIFAHQAVQSFGSSKFVFSEAKALGLAENTENPDDPDSYLFRVYAPYLSKPESTPTPTPPPPDGSSKFLFGVENWYFGNDANMNNDILPLGVLWLRRNGLLWGEVEASEGLRDWTKISGMEYEFKFVSEKGKNQVLIIRYTPTWARQYSNSHCGPIKDAKIAAFADFTKEVVTRYSKPPYNVMYYEIWNEPDAPIWDTTIPPYINVNYGCWGTNPIFGWGVGDPYFNGKYYAQVLKAVYPKMKEANKNIKVIIGGLVLDCDPINPPAGKTCESAKYLEGILKEGGGNYFDIVGFHAYDYYYSNEGNYGNTNWAVTRYTGPGVIAKTNYLRSVLSSYGFNNKPLMATEISLLCEVCLPTNNSFQITKAYYLIAAFAASIERNLDSAIWYTMYDSWRNNGLCDNNGCATRKYPAYDAMKFIVQELGYTNGASYLPHNIFHVYVINTVNKGKVRIMWSKDGTNQSITFPKTPSKVYSWKGEPITPAQTMTVGVAPIYVEGVD